MSRTSAAAFRYEPGLSPAPSSLRAGLQRARGLLDVKFRRRGEATILESLRQEGCLKARLTRPEPGSWTCLVALNCSGGVAAGDLLHVVLEAGEGARVTLAGQAAERFYRAMPGSLPAQLRTELQIAPGAAIEWLPQETILFNHANLERELDVRVTADAWFLAVETLIFGRTAMGEEVRQVRLRDRIRLRRDGRLILQDAVRLDGDAAALLDRPAVGGGARAVATIVHASPEAEAVLDGLRAVLSETQTQWGASGWNGMLVARICAVSGRYARSAVIAGLAALRGARPLPRVWMC